MKNKWTTTTRLRFEENVLKVNKLKRLSKVSAQTYRSTRNARTERSAKTTRTLSSTQTLAVLEIISVLVVLYILLVASPSIEHRIRCVTVQDNIRNTRKFKKIKCCLKVTVWINFWRLIQQMTFSLVFS